MGTRASDRISDFVPTQDVGEPKRARQSCLDHRRYRPGRRLPPAALLGKGYIVHGIKRRSSSFNTERVDELYLDPHEHETRFIMHYGDLTDATNVIRLVQEHQPDEIYNLAAQSHVQVSFETPEYTANADALGTLRLLEAIRILKLTDKVRFYQASTSELYGKVREVPQRETTPFYPRSPYAAAKLYAYWITVNYREAYGIHASNGILFNHEAPARRNVRHAQDHAPPSPPSSAASSNTSISAISTPSAIGACPRYVEGMWLILQQPTPDDYVLATGSMHSVREFVELAFRGVGRMIEWRNGRRGGRSRAKNRQNPRAHRSPLFPADRGRRALRRSEQGARAPGLEPQDLVQGARRRNGRKRS